VTFPLRRLRSSLAVMIALGVTSAVALSAPAAQAAGPINLGACNDAALSTPFAAWSDPSSYELAPGGDFESSSWQLSGRAAAVSGSEPFAATGTPGSASLSLPAGSSAHSPETCVDAAYPTIRFFASGLGTVAVGVDYDGVYLPAGVAVSLGEWQPTQIMLTSSALPAALSGGTTDVSLVLTALTGNVRVDDVFIDPWNRG
jgi:opacity protein-like surface antigen